MLRRVGVGAREQQPVARLVRLRRPDLRAVHDPLVAVADGAGRQAGDVGTGAGLAEELAPDLLGGEDRPQEALLLLARAAGDDRRAAHADAHGVADPRVATAGRFERLVDDLLQRRARRRGRRGRPGSPCARVRRRTARRGRWSRRRRACSARSRSTRSRTSAAVTMRTLRARDRPGRGRSRRDGERVGVELDVERTHGAVDLLDRARADDRRGDHRVGEQPRQRDVGGCVAELGAELLPLLELRTHVLDPVLDVLVAPATSGRTVGEHAAEQPAAERAPRDHADPVVLARREHLELDGAGVEVVEALLRHEAERAPRVPRLRWPARCASPRSCCCRRTAPCPAARARPWPARSRPTACRGRRGASGRGRCSRSAAGGGCRRTRAG